MFAPWGCCVISWPTGGGGPSHRTSESGGNGKGKQFLQQKQEAGPHGWRPAPGVINSAQPAPPSPSPHTGPGPLFTVPTSQGSKHRSPRNANLGAQQSAPGRKTHLKPPVVSPQVTRSTSCGLRSPAQLPFPELRVTSTQPVSGVWAPRCTISLETGCWD